ncbi:MAG: chemotaxis-specific protein-glutamate methyltransferase CheB [Gallionellaceae bacterium]|jgi:two-component system chemotaxis response regulator CheB
MAKIRVVITDDSSLARGLLRDFLESEEDIEVVGEAENGQQAIDLARELKPNLITMDLEMPVMDGMQAIEEIMFNKAVPILVVSSVADAHNALEAVRRGALEVVRKPDYTPEQAAEFVAKVRMLAGVAVITRMRPRTPLIPAPPIISATSSISMPAIDPSRYSRIFAIACSTGGPQALAQILPALPANFPCPIVIAQHISDGFAAGMADWLATLCKMPVRLAIEGELLQAGIIYISPSERHFGISATRRVSLVERTATDIYHPSCDVLLSAAADVFGQNTVGIILTGMGHDGARGIAHIRAKGGVTLGQDETSSIIYGMNRVAIEAGSVQHILPVESFAGKMMQLATIPLTSPAMWGLS